MAPPKEKTPSLQQQLDEVKQQQAAERQRSDRIQKKLQAIVILNTFKDQVLARTERWSICARNIGSAYVRAVKNHRGALTAADKLKALETSALFVALTLLTGSTLVWGAAGLAGAKGLLGSILRDTLDSSLGKGVRFLGAPATSLAPTPDALSAEPQEFQNQQENVVSTFRAAALDQFARTSLAIERASEDGWDDWDEATMKREIDGWQARADKLKGMTVSAVAESEKKIGEMADDLERAIWARWLPNLHQVKESKQIKSNPDGTNARVEMVTEDVWESVYSPVEDRLIALGILTEAGVEIHWYQSANSEDTKLINWAKWTFKPKPWVGE